jgi:predicted nucleic acid-binding protein
MAAVTPPAVEVVDASVAVEWFVESGPAFSGAVGVLERIRDDPGRFVVPELFFQEMHAVLCRKLASAVDVGAALRNLWRLGMRCLPWEPEVAELAAEVAFRFRISGYDATYLAAAQLTGGVWLTFDRKAHQRVASLGLSRLV